SASIPGRLGPQVALSAQFYAAFAVIGRYVRKQACKGQKRIRRLSTLLREKDYTSFGLYIISDTKHLVFALSISLAILSAFRMVYVILVASQIIGKEFNRLLKRYFNHRRPAISGKKSPGMPSYHAQHSFAFALYISYVGLSHWLWPLIWASFVSWSRLALMVHSFDQVAVGCGIGALWGVTFARLCTSLVTLEGVTE
ncbi:hypothetical protein AAMO2058_001477500, partial [Amorphochlora amoebiformis]